MNKRTQDRYEFLERKRTVDAAWFITLPFLLLFAGVLWNYRMAAIPFIPLLKANLALTACYIILHLFIEKVEMEIRHVRWFILLSFFLILLQITTTIHFLGGTDSIPFFSLYLIPIVASGVLFSGWYPLGCTIISVGMLTMLYLLEEPAFAWYLVNLGMPQRFAAVFERFSVQHYPVFGLELGPEALFTILISYLFISLAFAFLSQSTGPLLDRLYRMAAYLEMDIKGREDLFNLSLSNAPTGFIIGYRSNYQAVHVNKNALNTLGIKEEEIKGRDIFSLIHFASDSASFLREKIDHRENVDSAIVPATIGGSVNAFFQIRLSMLDYPTPAGEEGLFVLIMSNVTDEMEMSNIISNSGEAIVFIDNAGAVQLFNRSAQYLFPSLAKGIIFDEALRASGAFSEKVSQAISGGETIDGRVTFKEKTFFFSSSTPKGPTGIELGILFTLKDITNEEIFYNLSMKDELTRLYNRRYFFDMMGKELAQAQRYPKPLSLAVMDIDFFKKVNDTYGHNAGDIILKTFAKTISSGLRRADVVARIGGEEFAIYMPFVDARGAGKLCEKIRAEVEKLRTTFENHTIPITCSIGVAEYSKDDEISNLLTKADNALYEAKRSGRNKVVVFDEPCKI